MNTNKECIEQLKKDRICVINTLQNICSGDLPPIINKGGKKWEYQLHRIMFAMGILEQTKSQLISEITEKVGTDRLLRTFRMMQHATNNELNNVEVISITQRVEE